MPVSAAAALLDSWLARVLKPEARTWLDAQVAACAAPGADLAVAFFPAFSAAARRCGRDHLGLDAGDLAAAERARPGWRPQAWTRDQAARARLLLALPTDDCGRLVGLLDRLAATAELLELVALYQTLPLLGHAPRHRDRAAEGVRNNIKAVFEAVALDNPYAAEQLTDGAWNQMVLKCLFVGSPLHRVVGIDGRANAALTRMLCDFAHERWAAKRAVPPELWRCVALTPDEPAMVDLGRALGGDDARCAQGAALALAASAAPAASSLLARHAGIAAGATWSSLSVPP